MAPGIYMLYGADVLVGVAIIFLCRATIKLRRKIRKDLEEIRASSKRKELLVATVRKEQRQKWALSLALMSQDEVEDIQDLFHLHCINSNQHYQSSYDIPFGDAFPLYYELVKVYEKYHEN